MQRITSMENFYNFRKQFSCNFERSDQKNKDGSVFDLKIREKLNKKIIRTMQRPTSRSPFYNFRNKFSYNFERSDPKSKDGRPSASKLEKN